MTSVQAEAMRGLGSWHGGMSVWPPLCFPTCCLFFLLKIILSAANMSLDDRRFMAASKVLGEESVKEQAQPQDDKER